VEDGNTDAFLTIFDEKGASIKLSTFLGGSSNDEGAAVTLDSRDNIYLAGITESANFPVANPAQAGLGGGFDAFVTKLDSSGQTTTFTIGTSSLNNFSGQVNLANATLTPANSDNSITLSGNSIAVGKTGTLTVKTSGKTPLSTFDVSVTGTSGTLTHIATARV